MTHQISFGILQASVLLLMGQGDSWESPKYQLSQWDSHLKFAQLDISFNYILCLLDILNAFLKISSGKLM